AVSRRRGAHGVAGAQAARGLRGRGAGRQSRRSPGRLRSLGLGSRPQRDLEGARTVAGQARANGAGDRRERPRARGRAGGRAIERRLSMGAYFWITILVIVVGVV